MASSNLATIDKDTEFQQQEIKEFLNQADGGAVKSLSNKLQELLKYFPVGSPQPESSDRSPRFLTKSSISDENGKQSNSIQIDQYENLSAELQQCEAIYQIQSNIIGILAKHQLNLSGALQKYRQKVLGKIEHSLSQEMVPNRDSVEVDDHGPSEEANLGKRSLIALLKTQSSKDGRLKPTTAEKGVQVCNSQPELVLGLGLTEGISSQPNQFQTGHPARTIGANQPEDPKPNSGNDHTEGSDEAFIRKRISEVFKLVSLARGSQSEKPGDSSNSNKKASNFQGLQASQSGTGSIYK